MTLRLGWFTTARGPGSLAMYETVSTAILTGTLDAEFAFVFSNREPGEDEISDDFFRRVEENHHPLVTRSSVEYRRSVGAQRSRPGEKLPEWRLDYDQKVDEQLSDYQFDLGVLAGYMLIFGSTFVQRHPLLNLHPALPGGPSGTWRDVIGTLVRERAKESGVMIHLAIPEVDAGPVVTYCRYPLRGPDLDTLWSENDFDQEGNQSPLFRMIRHLGVQYESPLLLATIEEFATGRLQAVEGQVLGPDGKPSPAIELTDQVRSHLE